ncbi:Regulated SNARE like domain [Trypanosoma vivax]|nr:Regulated SNARE like domain [Trypanosoma vivax]KAH8612067.1 Regulated SNARE like domain [Trypanosoma vivax]KAH8612073.1 Regulated SNARE like domain [Trypanosoma vivax]KAH8612077.1 Regulated SNARE like domain [Trypanosoma vivax]KAH8612098.1 Regulated SNARE like domain [Trypanosoma vivax]
MLHFTLIVRQRDALALSADTDACGAEVEQCKAAAKTLLRKLSVEHSNPSADVPPMLLVPWKGYAFYVLSECGVLFLTMCNAASPGNVPIAYLVEVAREFLHQYGTQIDAATRPYCFIKFDLYLLRTKKIFVAPSSSRGMDVTHSERAPVVRRTFDEIMSGARSRGEAPGFSAVRNNEDEGTHWLLVALFLCFVVAALVCVAYAATG